ncbi:MAG: YgiT-type zinc finger protein [Nitrospinae bacterium]|nr:YgiT-type zinc finger protein [Nitrospinota bacterium]
MKCHLCGSELQSQKTDLPFKVSDHTIVIIKALPVLQCGNCHEYLIEDAAMQKVDGILEKAGLEAELEVVNYAA